MNKLISNTPANPKLNFFPKIDINIQHSQNINVYKKQLKYLYKKVDSMSSLLWSHENHLVGKRLRSEYNGFDDKILKWKNNKTTQIGYGEITMVIIFICNINLYLGINE